MPTQCGKGGQRLLAFGVEEAFELKSRLQLFEGNLKRACADGLHEFGDELHLAALFVDGDFAADEDVQAVLGTEAKERGLTAEEHDGQLRFAIFQSEVDVAGGRGAQIGDLALDPEIGVFALDGIRGRRRRVQRRSRCGGGGPWELRRRSRAGRAAWNCSHEKVYTAATRLNPL